MKKDTLRFIIIAIILILILIGGCFLLKSLMNKNQETIINKEPLNTKLNMDVVFSNLEKLYNDELDLYEDEQIEEQDPSGKIIEKKPEDQVEMINESSGEQIKNNNPYDEDSSNRFHPLEVTEEQDTSKYEIENEEPRETTTDDGKIHAISGDELNDYLNSEELNGLIRRAIIKTDDDIVDEVWIVKLNDKESQEKVARILGNRIRKLKDGFKENKTELMVIESSEIKQENDVVIMIASPNKASIENIIAKEMTKE